MKDKDSESKLRVLKSDDFVRLGGEGEGIDDSRFINSCLTKVFQGNKLNETEYYEVDIHRYAEKAGLAYNVAYQEVKALAKKHSETSLNVTLPSGAIWCTPLIYDFVYDDSEKYVKIKWNKKLIPLISDLDSMEDGRWHLYNPETDAVSSNKVYLLTEFLQKNKYKLERKPYTFTILTTDLREATGSLKSYPEYKDFNRKVIQPAIKEMKRVFGIDISHKGSKREVTFWRTKHD